MPFEQPLDRLQRVGAVVAEQRADDRAGVDDGQPVLVAAFACTQLPGRPLGDGLRAHVGREARVVGISPVLLGQRLRLGALAASRIAAIEEVTTTRLTPAVERLAAAPAACPRGPARSARPDPSAASAGRARRRAARSRSPRSRCPSARRSSRSACVDGEMWPRARPATRPRRGHRARGTGCGPWSGLCSRAGAGRRCTSRRGSPNPPVTRTVLPSPSAIGLP